MNITYIEPLSKAWNHMISSLFKPFDIGKWFAIGFSAFLAGLLDYPGGNGSNDFKGDDYRRIPEEIHQVPDLFYQWLAENPGWAMFILIVAVVIVILVILCTWLSSRGKFMFIHNVVHNNKELKKPWHEYEQEGNSLFLWRLVFGLVIFCLVILFLYSIFSILIEMRYQDFYPGLLMPLIGLGFLFMLSMIIVAYISLFLNDFVVPIMYKHKISANQAWSKFLDIFKSHFWHFVLYGLFIFFLGILTFIGVVLLWVFTCCIGFILTVIPYIGSVFLLPISFTFRGLSVAFLEQFGDEFKLFPENEVVIENQ